MAVSYNIQYKLLQVLYKFRLIMFYNVYTLIIS